MVRRTSFFFSPWLAHSQGLLFFLQLPRYVTFQDPRSKPFFAELCVYQTPAEEKEPSNAGDAELPESLPEVVCSRICRLYDSEGQLKQGCTSFYTLKRFDT
jgi:hypothetical protein